MGVARTSTCMRSAAVVVGRAKETRATPVRTSCSALEACSKLRSSTQAKAPGRSIGIRARGW